MTAPEILDEAAAVRRAQVLAARPGRTLLGITGAPGAGKSTLASAVVAAVREHEGPDAVALVPMDGFHLAQTALEQLGRAERKGAPDTFDAHGFAALLRRLRSHDPAAPTPAEIVVWAPRFDREREDPTAGAIPVPSDVRLVVVEGNYLLLEDDPWAAVHGLLDEVWFVETEERERLRRLTERHVRFGKAPDAAHAWARGPDQRNADLIAAGRARADRVVTR